MADDTPGVDPYDAVLADLRGKRDQIDQAIAAIEAIRGGAGAASSAKPVNSVVPDGPVDLLGLSISDAAKKLLSSKRTTLKNTDLVALFKAGGLHLNSKDWVNTIGAVLSRRANDVGDIVKIDRGTWGLKEWYPNRSFKKEKDPAKPDEAKASGGFTTDPAVAWPDTVAPPVPSAFVRRV